MPSARWPLPAKLIVGLLQVRPHHVLHADGILLVSTQGQPAFPALLGAVAYTGARFMATLAIGIDPQLQAVQLVDTLGDDVDHAEEGIIAVQGGAGAGCIFDPVYQVHINEELRPQQAGIARYFR
jgi:hypothetical protein